MHNPGPSLPGGLTLGNAVSTPGSWDVMDLRDIELGLPGYPGALSLPASLRQVEGITEQACSWWLPQAGCYKRQWPWSADSSCI
jgi:hypothetical protein